MDKSLKAFSAKKIITMNLLCHPVKWLYLTAIRLLLPDQ
ncbi:hypothetical protein JCM19233_779 [Vibrio astriarenae]|nr:hypothetical protein JCM19233_779 [Vibrio sp. C7]